ncbi:MAG: 2-C-methyl-D-erythritol 4-phosphate cytidylyltransferase [Treponema sp.]|jgi:2-C-methyl-D-erythritol 4-phosphate cytidylyltransferase/2-C-methyl-D-erythritol 4-phosphate cytidylyltransferase/2-C-methyl-D-erythritol 2,4-cyclodiphosphate synthase|nr:2-C-methyl-D-erythritol 4-phosphate cytidylyltransferase [Treponema sp.]
MEVPIGAVICAAGSSSRIGGIKKEYRVLPGKTDPEGKPLTVLGSAVSAFAAVQRIAFLVITVPADAERGEAAARAALPLRFFVPKGKPSVLFVPGGPTRRASVHHALSLLAAYGPGYVLIHDGARPWIDESLIEQVIDAAQEYGAAIPLLPLTETPKEIDEKGFIRGHLKRTSIGTAQTPQGFAFPAILHAHDQAAERELFEHKEYTDDAEVWGEFIGPVAVVAGSPENRKITFPGDLG